MGRGNRCALTNVRNWAEREEEVRQVPVRIFILLMLLSFSQHVFAAVLPFSHCLKEAGGFPTGLLHATERKSNCGFSFKEQKTNTIQTILTRHLHNIPRDNFSGLDHLHTLSVRTVDFAHLRLVLLESLDGIFSITLL